MTSSVLRQGGSSFGQVIVVPLLHLGLGRLSGNGFGWHPHGFRTGKPNVGMRDLVPLLPAG